MYIELPPIVSFGIISLRNFYGQFSLKNVLQRNFHHIIAPLAETINNEVNVPVLRQFVDSLYPSVLELSKRRKNLPWVGPLVQLLLSVSQKQYFLNHWSIYLDYCLAALKDVKYSRVCLDSVSRLVWVYCVRHRCEANNTTATRLNLILKNIFPVGARHVTPREMPSAYFVRILSFIGRVQKIDRKLNIFIYISL